MPPSVPSEPVAPKRSKWPTRARFKELLADYGRVALWTYFSIFALVLGGFALAISFGLSVESAEGGVGTLGAAYVATKVTQPLRIFATLGLTPIVAALLQRWKGDKPQAKPAAAD